MQKWEYLLIQMIFDINILNPVVEVFVNGKSYAKFKPGLELHSKGHITSPDIIEFLNHYGEQGWEMVSSNNSSGALVGIPKSIWFKRPKQESV